MKLFNAKFILDSCQALETPGEYDITATVVDNSGTFFASDSKEGDIIYFNGLTLGEILLRYKVKTIKSKVGAKLTAVIVWDMEEEAIEPLVGFDGIIGEPINEIGLSMISNIFVNSCDESVISAARNYEQKLLSEHLTAVDDKIKYPTLGYSLIEE